MAKIGALFTISLLSYYVSFGQCSTKDCLIPMARQQLANHKWPANYSFDIHFISGQYSIAVYIGLSATEIINAELVNINASKTGNEIAEATNKVSGLGHINIVFVYFDRSLYTTGAVIMYKAHACDGKLTAIQQVPSDPNYMNVVKSSYDMGQRDMLQKYKLSDNQFLIHCYLDNSKNQNHGTYTVLCVVNLVENLKAVKVGNEKEKLGNIANYLKQDGPYKKVLFRYRNKYNSSETIDYFFDYKNGQLHW
jgi:hypothetical protein